MGLLSVNNEEQIPTAELPPSDWTPRPEPEPEPEPEQLTEQELESSTADTRPLPPEMAAQMITEPKTDEEEMESKVTPTENTAPEVNRRSSGPLLDLGDFEPAHAAAEEDFVLDIDLDEFAEPAPMVTLFPSDAVTERIGGAEDRQPDNQEFRMVRVTDSDDDSAETTAPEPFRTTVDPMAETIDMMPPLIRPAPKAEPERAFAEPKIFEGDTLRTGTSVAEAGQISLEQLSPEAIDAIARRAVEMLSEKVVQEIAWEVVPQLAELLIKRQLEEKNS
ncbi:MAG: hypothetical protein AABN95_17535 [Acidobacteriota bacterium]